MTVVRVLAVATIGLPFIISPMAGYAARKLVTHIAENYFRGRNACGGPSYVEPAQIETVANRYGTAAGRLTTGAVFTVFLAIFRWAGLKDRSQFH